MGDSVKKGKMVAVNCVTGDGTTVKLPEDVAAVLNLCGLCLYFTSAFCHVETKCAGEVDGAMITSFVWDCEDFGWTAPLIDWVRNGMPKREPGVQR